FYFKELISSSAITNAAVTYVWAFGSGLINPDGGKGPGYYSFFFDTGNVTEVGTYIITITAVKQNFSDGIPSSSLLITIINRPTLLNSNDDVLYLRYTFIVLDSHNFTFGYTDVLTSKNISNADEKSFILIKREANGDPIFGSSVIGTLFETANHRYILDLDTETLQIGDYSIVVSFDKDNYNLRVAVISLTIVKREFTPDFFTITNLNLASGGSLQFQITLTDLDQSAPLQGVNLTLTINGIVYDTFTGGITDNLDGTYTVNSLPIAEPFFGVETYVATLTIKKANYTSQTRVFTVKIQMSEIFPGMPTFYFVLITASVIGVLGSLTAYRVIQQARIPKHVKKIRKIKKLIKSKKKVIEGISIPTKAEMIAKLFSKDWKEIDLSIEETLGITGLKKKFPTKGIIEKGKEQRISKLKVSKEKAEAKSIRDKEKQIKKEAAAKIKEENAIKAAELKAIKDKEKLAQKEADAKIKEENAIKAAELKAIKDKEKLAQKEAELKTKKEKDEENA
ncbi:hypothetical protein LCGC14_2468780, partial [marine sediment metagenome]